MNLQYVPLLRIQRELQGIPRGLGRFQQYLRTVLNRDAAGRTLGFTPRGLSAWAELARALHDAIANAGASWK
jgi:hypothetical protein